MEFYFITNLSMQCNIDLSWNPDSGIKRNHLGFQHLAQHRFSLTPVIAVTWNYFWTPKYRYILDQKF
jgi:hypothetical protein